MRLHSVDVLAVVRERESYFGPGEGHALELLHDVPELHIVAPQELAAGGNVVEQVAYGDVGTRRTADLPGTPVLRGGHRHLNAHFVLGTAGAEGHLRHGGDGSQGFAAEAEGEDVVEVFGRSQFAGGVPLEAEHGVVGRHAAAVVDDLDEGSAGILHHDPDVRRSGIHRILHEFLHHGSGALDHLSRSNHVGNILG